MKRVALLGYGLAGSVFHAPLIEATRGLKLAAVVTSSRERQLEASRRHDGVRVLDRVEEVWEGDYDLAVVATPNDSHVTLARAALERGMAVVVDKPLAATAREARALVELARRKGQLLTVFQNRRWDGDFLTLKSLLDELGRLQRFESRYERWRPEIKPGWRERPDPALAGGVLYDLGAHVIDQVLSLLGLPSHVYAELAQRRPGAAVDDDAFLALTFPGEVQAHLWMSAVTASLGPRFRVLGSRGGYEKYGVDIQEEQLRGGLMPGHPAFGLEPESHWGHLVAGEERRLVPTRRGEYLTFYEQLGGALEGRGPVPVDPLDAVRSLEVLEAARKSAREGRVVRLGSRSSG